MKKLTYIALLLCSGAALAAPPEWANNDKDRTRPVRPGTDITNVNTNVNAQQQAQHQTQFATGGNAASLSSATGGSSTSNATGGNATGGTSSASVANANNVSASNSGVSTTVNNVSTSPSDVTVRSTGAAPDILTTPTAPCRIAVGVSGGWIGGALGFGTSVEDEGCTLRENARLLHNFGEKAAALKLMCNDAKVAAVLSICPAPAATPQVEVSVKP